MLFDVVCLAALLPLALSASVAVTDIQGPAFVSPYSGKKFASGFWIAGTANGDTRVSNGLYVYTTSTTVLAKVAVGYNITLSGTVSEYRSSSDPFDLYGTELESPTSIVVNSQNNTITPVVIGKDRIPPTQLLSALDVGADGYLSVPNGASNLTTINATLVPATYGIDFWESLEGQLVTVPGPIVVDFPDYYGDIWVHGDWPVPGKNSRGGLTMINGTNGLPTGNPGMILIGDPLDGTKNPSVSVGTNLSDISGPIIFQYGYFYLLPTTAPTVKATPTTTIPASNITSSTSDCTLTLGDYNIDNFGPKATQLPAVATHIAKYLNTPDLVFLQEIQDNSGETDDGTVSANTTLSNLVAAISAAGGAFTYSYIDIDPINDQDGGVPGGNIRQAYLWNPQKISLVPGSPVGGSLDATAVATDSNGDLTLTYNPGRIDPANAAWNASRKPLVAAWETPKGNRFFTVNLQLTAKLDSTTLEANPRPPINAFVDQRTSQVEVISTFVNTILEKDSSASIIVGGDCNEYLYTRSVFAPLISVLTDIDSLAGIPVEERYTYIYDGQTEQLDHLFVSSSIASRPVAAQHIHVNNWATSLATRASDHDPTVAQLQVC
ncbi:hypothetical protein HWV62_45637 [Athelia sp. TMB]|nr:hypothetical protein HWV62_45637 [Athelia sp. TMB]